MMKYIYVQQAKDILYNTSHKVYYMNDRGTYSEVVDITQTSASVDSAYTIVCTDGIVSQVSSNYVLVYDNSYM